MRLIGYVHLDSIKEMLLKLIEHVVMMKI